MISPVDFLASLQFIPGHLDWATLRERLAGDLARPGREDLAQIIAAAGEVEKGDAVRPQHREGAVETLGAEVDAAVVGGGPGRPRRLRHAHLRGAGD